jgi:iron complex outermembrane recepter protein
MRAVAVSPGKKNSAQLLDLPKPHRRSDQCLVRVLEVGVDGTDREIDSGLYGAAPERDDVLIIGHESLGEVAEDNGEGGPAKGELVVATVRRPDPNCCASCLRGEFDFCLTSDYQERGIKQQHGYMAESRLSVGADEAYQDGAILFYSLTPEGERGSTLSTDKREGANNFGVYAQEALSFGAWEATLGVRYDNVTYYAQDFLNPTLDDTRSFEKLTPKLGLLWKLSDRHSIYANLGGGIEVPAGNETDPAPGATNPTALNALLDLIESTTYEIGTKQALDLGSGFLRALFYDLALYHTNVTNEIVPYQGGRFYFTAAQARRTGAELGLELSTAPGLSIHGAVTVSRNTYSEYVVDSTYYSRPGLSADFSGNRIVGIPDYFYNVSAAYVPSFLNRLRFRVEMEQVDSYFANDANTTEVDGYMLRSAGVSLSQPLVVGGVKLRASAQLENLFDTNYVASAFLNPDLVNGAAAAYEPGLPRHLIVSVSVGR